MRGLMVVCSVCLVILWLAIWFWFWGCSCCGLRCSCVADCLIWCVNCVVDMVNFGFMMLFGGG